MKNLLLVLSLIFGVAQADPSPSNDSCKDDFFVCRVTYTSTHGYEVKEPVVGEGIGRSAAIEDLLRSCRDMSAYDHQEPCVQAVREGKFSCREL